MAWVWLGLALLVLVAELLTGTIFLLFVSLGMLLPGLVLFFRPELALSLQLLLFSVFVLIGLFVYMRSRKRKRFREDNHMIGLDIGNLVEVRELGNRAMYRGAGWDVVLQGSTEPLQPGRYRITEVRGTALVVVPSDEPTAGVA